MLWVPIAIADLDLSALVKLMIVLTISFALLLIAYECVVRGTAVGPRPDRRRLARKAATIRLELTAPSYDRIETEYGSKQRV